jgi:hypothetical protein
MRPMSFECMITKAIDKHSKYVTHIAFQRQQLLRERVSLLLSYLHCPSCLSTATRLHKGMSSTACTRIDKNVPEPFLPPQILNGWPQIEPGLTLHIKIRFARRMSKRINTPLVSVTKTNCNRGVAIAEKSMRGPYCDANLIS